MPKLNRKRRQRPYDPGEGWRGDQGPTTAAQRAYTRIVKVEGDKNGQGMKIRDGVLERLHRLDTGISTRQFNAGTAIRTAFELTQLSPDGIVREYVDSSPDPGAVTAAQADAQQRFNRVFKLVPPAHREIVSLVCCEDRPLPQGRAWGMHCAMLQVALDLVANDLERPTP